jgi:hypothetical protein
MPLFDLQTVVLGVLKNATFIAEIVTFKKRARDVSEWSIIRARGITKETEGAQLATLIGYL